MSDSGLREALARLLQESADSVKHTAGECALTYSRSGSGCCDPVACTCDYAQRVRERQAAVMEAVVGWYASEPSKYDTIDGRLRMALAAGQAHLQEDK